MFSLIQMLGRAAPMIDIVDVGAMWLGAEHVPYRALLQGGRARVVGFEPVQRECDRLNAMKLPGHAYLPYFIGDGCEREFVETNSGMTSSFYEPDLAFCGRFNGLAEVMQPVDRRRVGTARLDDVGEIRSVDFLKVDVQGGELDVFRGGARALDTALVVQTEVNFAPLYKGAPLFADVDAHLRGAGFMFHTFASILGRSLRPLLVSNDPYKPVRQMLWADAVYVKDFSRLPALTPEQLLKMAVILHEVYQSMDLAAVALQHHDAKCGASLWAVYMTRLLNGQKPPPQPPL